MPMGDRNVSFLGAFRFFLVEGRCTEGSQASKQNENKRHRTEMIGSAGNPNMSPMFSVFWALPPARVECRFFRA